MNYLETWPAHLSIRVISKDKVIHSTQIGSCVAIIFNRERALNNSFEITTENLPFQLKLFIECAYTKSVSPRRPLPTPALTTLPLRYHSSGKLLPSLVELAPNPFDQRPSSASSASAANNHALVGEHSFVLIERIDVCAPHRRHGIGSKMLSAVLADAQAVLPAVRFAVSWPCASDVDLVDMGFPAGAKCPPGLGQQRAEDFHHAVGFRKLGLTRFWAMAL